MRDWKREEKKREGGDKGRDEGWGGKSVGAGVSDCDVSVW